VGGAKTTDTARKKAKGEKNRGPVKESPEHRRVLYVGHKKGVERARKERGMVGSVAGRGAKGLGGGGKKFLERGGRLDTISHKKNGYR